MFSTPPISRSRRLLLRILFQHAVAHQERQHQALSGDYEDDEDDEDDEEEASRSDDGDDNDGDGRPSGEAIGDEERSDGRGNDRRRSGRRRSIRRRVTPRVLSSEEALALGSVCRFCLDGPPSPTDSDPPSQPSLELEDRRLVSPCDCTGHSAFVHVSCLRRWQVRCLFRPTTFLAVAGAVTTGPPTADRCPVCTARYTVTPPRLKSGLLRRGTVLLRSPPPPPDDTVGESASRDVAAGRGSRWDKTVILLWGGSELEHAEHPTEDSTGERNAASTTSGNRRRRRRKMCSVHGTILNAPLPQPESIVRSRRCGDALLSNVQCRIGGPVCGGRFDVVRYSMIHGGPRRREDESNESPSLHEASNDRVTTETAVSMSAFETTDHSTEGSETSVAPATDDDAQTPSAWQLVLDNSNGGVGGEPAPPLAPKFFDEEELRCALEGTADHHDPRGDDARADQLLSPVVLFRGYCKWSPGQLECEILRGLWRIVARNKDARMVVNKCLAPVRPEGNRSRVGTIDELLSGGDNGERIDAVWDNIMRCDSLGGNGSRVLLSPSDLLENPFTEN